MTVFTRGCSKTWPVDKLLLLWDVSAAKVWELFRDSPARLYLCFHADVGVSYEWARLLVAVCHSGSPAGSVWVTWRLSVLSERHWWLSGLELPDHREGFLQPLCVWRLSSGQEGESGGPGLHRRDGVDPRRTGRTDAGLFHPKGRVVFIAGGVETVCCGRLSQRFCVLFKTDCQRWNYKRIKCVFIYISFLCVRVEIMILLNSDIGI